MDPAPALSIFRAAGCLDVAIRLCALSPRASPWLLPAMFWILQNPWKWIEERRGKTQKKRGKTKVWTTGKKARKRVLCSWHCHKCQRAHQTCHKRDPRRFILETFQGLGPEKSFCSTLAYQSCKVKMRTRFHQAPAAT